MPKSRRWWNVSTSSGFEPNPCVFACRRRVVGDGSARCSGPVTRAADVVRPGDQAPRGWTHFRPTGHPPTFGGSNTSCPMPAPTSRPSPACSGRGRTVPARGRSRPRTRPATEHPRADVLRRRRTAATGAPSPTAQEMSSSRSRRPAASCFAASADTPVSPKNWRISFLAMRSATPGCWSNSNSTSVRAVELALRAEDRLLPGVVPLGLLHELAVVYAPAGERAGGFLDIRLRIVPDAEGEQFHQLAGRGSRSRAPCGWSARPGRSQQRRVRGRPRSAAAANFPEGVLPQGVVLPSHQPGVVHLARWRWRSGRATGG